MKKPIDPFKDLSQEEIDKKIEALRDLEITKEEERAMIIAAIKAIVPPVILIFFILYIIVSIIF